MSGGARSSHKFRNLALRDRSMIERWARFCNSSNEFNSPQTFEYGHRDTPSLPIADHESRITFRGYSQPRPVRRADRWRKRGGCAWWARNELQCRGGHAFGNSVGARQQRASGEHLRADRHGGFVPVRFRCHWLSPRQIIPGATNRTGAFGQAAANRSDHAQPDLTDRRCGHIRVARRPPQRKDRGRIFRKDREEGNCGVCHCRRRTAGKERLST